MGRFRVAGSEHRAAAMPDLPTAAEAGVPDYRLDPWFGLLTTARTPEPVLAKLNREIVRILALPDVKERLRSRAPPRLAQFDAHIKAEVAKFREIIQGFGESGRGKGDINAGDQPSTDL